MMSPLCSLRLLSAADFGISSSLTWRNTNKHDISRGGGGGGGGGGGSEG